jgi:hypothetical protein
LSQVISLDSSLQLAQTGRFVIVITKKLVKSFLRTRVKEHIGRRPNSNETFDSFELGQLELETLTDNMEAYLEKKGVTVKLDQNSFTDNCTLNDAASLIYAMCIGVTIETAQVKEGAKIEIIHPLLGPSMAVIARFHERSGHANSETFNCDVELIFRAFLEKNAIDVLLHTHAINQQTLNFIVQRKVSLLMFLEGSITFDTYCEHIACLGVSKSAKIVSYDTVLERCEHWLVQLDDVESHVITQHSSIARAHFGTRALRILLDLGIRTVADYVAARKPIRGIGSTTQSAINSKIKHLKAAKAIA